MDSCDKMNLVQEIELSSTHRTTPLAQVLGAVRFFPGSATQKPARSPWNLGVQKPQTELIAASHCASIFVAHHDRDDDTSGGIRNLIYLDLRRYTMIYVHIHKDLKLRL